VAHVQHVSSNNLAAKFASIAAYRSQLGMLFGGAKAMEAAVRRYMTELGSGQPAERVWLAPNLSDSIFSMSS
jgi:hypothetical protein